MHPKAKLVAGRLTGKMEVLLGLGRLSVYDQAFMPVLSFDNVPVEILTDEDGVLSAVLMGYQILIEQPAVVITHVGVVVSNRWSLVEIKPKRVFMQGELLTLDVKVPLILDEEDDT